MFSNNVSSSIDKDILTNIIRKSYWTASVIGVALYLVKSYLPEGVAGGFFYGSLCGTTNLYFLRVVLREATSPNGGKAIKAIWNGAGLVATISAYFYAFWRQWFNEPAMVTGFSYFILITVIVGIIRKKKERLD